MTTTHLTLVTVDGSDDSRVEYYVTHETREYAEKLAGYLSSLPTNAKPLLGFMTIAATIGFDDLTFMADYLADIVKEKGGRLFIGHWSDPVITAEGALKSYQPQQLPEILRNRHATFSHLYLRWERK